MSDENDAFSDIEKKRAERSGKPPSQDVDQKPAKKPRGRAAQKAKQDASLPIEQVEGVTSFFLDSTTNLLGTSKRSDDERTAVAQVSRNLFLKRVPSMENSEEILFALVVLPIGAAILFEWLERRNPDDLETSGSDRPDGIGKVVPGKPVDPGGIPRVESPSGRS